MVYYKSLEYELVGYEKSNYKGKMYNAIIKNKKSNKIVKVPFGSSEYENYQDKTGLNLYPHLIHGNTKRRRLYRSRHIKNIKNGYYSAGYFSMKILW